MNFEESYQLTFLLSVFEANDQGILVVDHKTGLVIAKNKRFFEIFNVPVEYWKDPNDNPILDWVKNQVLDSVSFLKLVKDLYADPNRNSHDIFDLKDSRTIERHSEPVKVNNNVLGRVWYFSDITERLKQSKKLTENQNLHRIIFEDNPVGLSTINAELEYISVNKAFREFLGYPESEILGRKMTEFTHPSDVEATILNAKRLFNTGHSLKRYEKRYLHKGGGTIWGLVTSRAVKNETTGIPFLLTVIEDVTYLKQQEIEFQKTQAKIIKASRMAEIGEMAGGIAHEINTPLAIIQSKADQLIRIRETGEIPTENFLVSLMTIVKTSDRIAKIIRSLRSFSRDSENDPLIPVLVGEIIDDTLQLCAERMRKDGVQIKVFVQDQVHINCRASQIGQVLLNLLSNAFDAVLNLPERWIEIDCQIKNERLQIAVTDSGRGVPSDIVNKLMLPFFTTKPVGKGTGLGLSISKGIAEAHGGQLSYSLRDGHTCFFLELPICQVGTLKVSS